MLSKCTDSYIVGCPTSPLCSLNNSVCCGSSSLCRTGFPGVSTVYPTLFVLFCFVGMFGASYPEGCLWKLTHETHFPSPFDPVSTVSPSTSPLDSHSRQSILSTVVSSERVLSFPFSSIVLITGHTIPSSGGNLVQI